MANEKNLKPFTSDQSREEAKKNGAKGGKRSGEARKEKATLAKTAQMMLDLSLSDIGKTQLQRKGVNINSLGENPTARDLIIAGMIASAGKGNADAAKFIMALEDRDGEREKLELEKLRKENERLQAQINEIKASTSALEQQKGVDAEGTKVEIYLPDNGRDKANDNPEGKDAE